VRRLAVAEIGSGGRVQMPERRDEQRIEVELEVRYRTAQEFLSAYSWNISGGGIFIRTQQPLPLNREVQLRFTLPGIDRTFMAHGLVVWTNPHPSRSSFPSGMGIKFMDLDPAAKNILADFVESKRTPPPPVQEQKPPAQKPPGR